MSKNNRFFNKIPIDIVRKIYKFDSTYHEFFKNNIICYIQKKWMIHWTCKYTGKNGIDLTGTNNCKLINNYINNDYIYTYYECKKICKKLNNVNEDFNYIPILI